MKLSTWSHALLGIGAVCALLAFVPMPFGLDAHAPGKLAGVGFGLLLAGGLRFLMPRWWRERNEEEFQSPASHRYRRSVMPAMAAYVVLVLLSSALLRHGIAALPLRMAVALLPVPPIVLVMRGFLVYLRQVDEFQRQIELESIGVGALVVSMAYVAGGFLQVGKVIDVPAGAAMIWVFPLICLGYGLGKFLAHRRYR